MALTWVKYSEGSSLQGAVLGGYDRGNPLYVARAAHEGSLVPGKYHAGYKTAYVSWGGKELEKKENFEILLAGSALEWKSADGGAVPDGAVEGGHRPDRGPLYIVRAKVDGCDSIGKLNPQHKFCHLPYGGKEHLVKQYQVLVNSPPSAPNPAPSKAPPMRTANVTPGSWFKSRPVGQIKSWHLSPGHCSSGFQNEGAANNLPCQPFSITGSCSQQQSSSPDTVSFHIF